MEKSDIIEALNSPETERSIRGTYRIISTHLKDEYKSMGEDAMVSYAKAYLINVYNSITNKYEKRNFIVAMKKGAIYQELDCFVKILNGTIAKPGEIVNKTVIKELNDLKDYKDTEVYRILSQDNKYIAKIIAKHHGFHTLNYFKKRASENPGVQSYLEHIIPEEELKIIEATKNYPIPNQIAHMLYDVKGNMHYYCDHTINSENEKLKNLLVSTKQDNPRFEIVFPDSTIVEYSNGDIRIKTYTFKQLVEYTKLFFAMDFEGLKETYESDEKPKVIGAPISYEKKGRDMLIEAYTIIRSMLLEYEDIYTQKMIDDYKEELNKIENLSKKYHL